MKSKVKYRMWFTDEELRSMPPIRLIPNGDPVVLSDWPNTTIYADKFQNATQAYKVQARIYGIWLKQRNKENTK